VARVGEPQSSRKRALDGWPVDSNLLPLVIFVAGMADVGSGTARFLMVAAGYRWQAAVLATIQITIFITAISAVAANLDNPFNIAGYALGWGTGTWVSMWVEGRVGLGFRLIQVINPDATLQVVERLRELGHRVTQMRATGQSGEVEVAMMVIRRRRMEPLLQEVSKIAPHAFVTVERVDRASGGSFVDSARIRRWPWAGW
jgi:uncharacterized protein YebE (UPF0316 family)